MMSASEQGQAPVRQRGRLALLVGIPGAVLLITIITCISCPITQALVSCSFPRSLQSRLSLDDVLLLSPDEGWVVGKRIVCGDFRLYNPGSLANDGHPPPP